MKQLHIHHDRQRPILVQQLTIPIQDPIPPDKIRPPLPLPPERIARTAHHAVHPSVVPSQREGKFGLHAEILLGRRFAPQVEGYHAVAVGGGGAPRMDAQVPVEAVDREGGGVGRFALFVGELGEVVDFDGGGGEAGGVAGGAHVDGLVVGGVGGDVLGGRIATGTRAGRAIPNVEDVSIDIEAHGVTTCAYGVWGCERRLMRAEADDSRCSIGVYGM
mmetsp:Transcript_4010/g.8901  ORF Transcript_4010/g.8901 Transcript_4010/m.8901 type:complete len:218 (+) Transcript_4010:1079-1732(+)